MRGTHPFPTGRTRSPEEHEARDALHAVGADLDDLDEGVPQKERSAEADLKHETPTSPMKGRLRVDAGSSRWRRSGPAFEYERENNLEEQARRTLWVSVSKTRYKAGQPPTLPSRHVRLRALRPQAERRTVD